MTMKTAAKALARALLGDYAIYFIYTNGEPQPSFDNEPAVVPVDLSVLARSADPLIAEQAGYGGDGSMAFALREGTEIVATCFYWHGERYRARGFWPLQPGEAKLVQIITTPAARGRGLATTLIASSTRQLMAQGWTRLYARIWHSNEPSLRAFGRAGWSRCALVIQVNPLRLQSPWRLRWATRSSR